ncbi:cupin domain-containing protein (plasmid) [Burkholderia sp. M6-3]
MSDSRYILRQAAQGVMASVSLRHPINNEAQRRTRSLGDAVGLRNIGVHLSVIAPNDVSTEQHVHTLGEEFIFIVSGRGTVVLDAERHDVCAGDFIGFPAGGPSHALLNTGSDDLVYLVGGDRPAFDVCDYPRLRKRLYLYSGQEGKKYDLVDLAQIAALQR